MQEFTVEIEAPVTVDLSGFVTGVKLDAIKRLATVSVQVSMTPEFMVVMERLARIGGSEKVCSISITPQQTGLGF